MDRQARLDGRQEHRLQHLRRRGGQLRIRDGALQGKPGKGGTLFTQEEFGDFVVRLEFKLPKGGNNGLAIRYPGHGDAAYSGICELQVLDDEYEKATGVVIFDQAMDILEFPTLRVSTRGIRFAALTA